MKNGMMAAMAAAATVLTASAANADVNVNLGSGSYGAGAGTSAVQGGIVGTLTGVTINFDYVGDVNSFSWASDLLLTINDGATGKHWGGFSVALEPVGSIDQTPTGWAGGGSITEPDGHYAFSDLGPLEGPPFLPGSWTIGILNGYSSGGVVQYNNVVVTLHGVNIPAPGAMALLGLAGMVGVRRRRRA
jgi:hypothetical protein